MHKLCKRRVPLYFWDNEPKWLIEPKNYVNTHKCEILLCGGILHSRLILLMHNAQVPMIVQCHKVLIVFYREGQSLFKWIFLMHFLYLWSPCEAFGLKKKSLWFENHFQDVPCACWLDSPLLVPLGCRCGWMCAVYAVCMCSGVVGERGFGFELLFKKVKTLCGWKWFRCWAHRFLIIPWVTTEEEGITLDNALLLGVSYIWRCHLYLYQIRVWE